VRRGVDGCCRDPDNSLEMPHFAVAGCTNGCLACWRACLRAVLRFGISASAQTTNSAQQPCAQRITSWSALGTSVTTLMLYTAVAHLVDARSDTQSAGCSCGPTRRPVGHSGSSALSCSDDITPTHLRMLWYMSHAMTVIAMSCCPPLPPLPAPPPPRQGGATAAAAAE
jgi:hypothetical protein